ncbi:hypothetical protein MKZ24_14395 [Paenibacillus sp. FSL R7-0297]|uniref:carbohydrate ABC transporter permease n=1 Tax=unclassified Paenibacillus TaxID=185978 RepID=UPI001E34B043|nr:hypothetical protein [Paenibacillus sp. FSL R5-0912]
MSGLEGFHFVGLDNYTRLVQDESFHRSLINNLIMIAVVPVAMFLALVLAALINKATYFKTFFKVIYFMPFISSFVAIALLWRVLYHPNNGFQRNGIWWRITGRYGLEPYRSHFITGIVRR